MIIGQFTYKFEELPAFRHLGGKASGLMTGEALIEFDRNSRAWSIKGIWLQNDLTSAPDLIALEPDFGIQANGPYEIVHSMLMTEVEEAIGEEVDRIIDTDNREGKAQ